MTMASGTRPRPRKGPLVPTPLPAGAAGRDRSILCVLHLRLGRAGRLCQPGGVPAGGAEFPRDELLSRLVEIRYERNDIAFERNMFRVRGDTVEIYPAYYKDDAIRVEFFGDEIDRISEINVVTGSPHPPC